MKDRLNKINITAKELRDICKEYEYNEEAHLMLDEGEDERPHLIKKAMQQLDKSEFIIFCLYMEYKSERKVAQLLGCSRTPLHLLLTKVKKEIKDNLCMIYY
jgi:hypothetical protein